MSDESSAVKNPISARRGDGRRNGEFRKDGVPVDPGPVVGGKRSPEGLPMIMRKNFPDSPRCGGRRSRDADRNPAPHSVRWGARTSGRRRYLSPAQPVPDYVEKPDDSKLIESAINGMLAGLDEGLSAPIVGADRPR